MKRMRRVRLAGVLALAVVCVAQGWHGPAHEVATKSAIASLPKELPAFFRAGGDSISHCSRDPDLFRERQDPPALRKGEHPEHYFDIELLKGATPPASRHEFVDLCIARGVRPADVGFLTYAVAEWTQRLAIAFAEHRKWPGNKHIQAKCLVYAGLMTHYAQDLCQPLHTTIHYDGRVGPDGAKSGRGVHVKLDSLLQKLKAEPAMVAKAIKPKAFDDLTAGIMAEFKVSHALVDRVYELSGRMPKLDAPLPADPALRQFATARLRAAANLTASLYLTAWRDSAKIKLPAWHKRSP